MTELYRIILLKAQDEKTDEEWWSAKLFYPGKSEDTQECSTLEGVMAEVLGVSNHAPVLQLVSDEVGETLSDGLAMNAPRLEVPGLDSMAVIAATCDGVKKTPAGRACEELELAQLNAPGGTEYSHDEIAELARSCFDDTTEQPTPREFELAEMVEQLLEELDHE